MFVFNKINKYNVTEKFVNIYGQIIYLHLRKHNNVMSVTVREHSKIYLHFMIYIVFFILNIIGVIFNVLNVAFFSVIFIILTSFIYIKSGSIIEESFISVEPLGYQLITKYVLGQKSEFIPYERVQNMFINEVIFKQKIIYILTILAKESNGEILIPLFTGCKPRLKCLEFIYKAFSQNVD